MATWPALGPVNPAVLSPWFSPPFSHAACSPASNASAAWGTANLALYFPVLLYDPVTVTKLWWQNGTVVSGTVDCGIYDEAGNRYISTTPQPQAGISAIQVFDITDTLIPAGLIYMALALSSATGTIWSPAASPAGGGMLFSGYRQLSGTLPNPATFATTIVAGMILPKFGALIAPRTVL